MGCLGSGEGDLAGQSYPEGPGHKGCYNRKLACGPPAAAAAAAAEEELGCTAAAQAHSKFADDSSTVPSTTELASSIADSTHAEMFRCL